MIFEGEAFGMHAACEGVFELKITVNMDVDVDKQKCSDLVIICCMLGHCQHRDSSLRKRHEIWIAFIDCVPAVAIVGEYSIEPSK